MSPSPAERFSALLARSGARGWSPDDDLDDGDGLRDDLGHGDGSARDGEVDDDVDTHGLAGVRPGLSRTLLLCLLGVVLTAVLVLVLAPSLLRGRGPLPGPAEGTGWESAHAQTAASSRADDRDATQAASVHVHVVGAVSSPGVVELPPSSRVSDAVEAAGGALSDADIDALNLARVLVDGEQIRVPRVGEEPAAATGSGDGSAPAGADVSGGGGGLIDVNAADAGQLEALPGIGPVTAQSIIDHREAIGRFGSVDELLDVTGIGDATLARIRESVTVG